MKIEKITRFIEKDLRKKILRDVRPGKKSSEKLPKITNERDLESSIYYHLRKEFGKSKNLKFGTNFSVHGYRKLGASERSQMMPDIVILEWKGYHEKPRLKLLMELKMMEPEEEWPFNISTKPKTKPKPTKKMIRKSHKKKFEKIFKTDKDYQSDFRKLNYAMTHDWVDHSYFVYLYHSPIITSKTVRLLIKNSQDTRSSMKFTPIVINAFDKKISGASKVTRGMRETRHKARQLNAAYPRPRHDPKKLWNECKKCGKIVGIHTDKEKRKCGLPYPVMSLEKRSQAANKAHATRKKVKQKMAAKRSEAGKRAAQTRKRKEAARRKST